MNFKQLKYFITVSKMGSVNKAAKELDISNITIKTALSKLHLELGVELFKISQTGVILTSEGEEFYKFACDILHKVENTKYFFKELKKESNNNLTIISNYSDIIRSTYVASCIEQKSENLNFNLVEVPLEEEVSLIKNNLGDIGFLVISSLSYKSFLQSISSNHMEFIKLFEGEVFVILGKGSSLYNSQSLSLDSLKDKTELIWCNDINRYYQKSNSVKSPSKNIFISDISQCTTLLSSMDSYLTTSSIIKLNEFKNKDFKIYSLKGLKEKNILGYIKNKNSKLTKEAMEFLLLVEESLKEE